MLQKGIWKQLQPPHVAFPLLVGALLGRVHLEPKLTVSPKAYDSTNHEIPTDQVDHGYFLLS